MQKMRESRKQKKVEYELLQQKLRQQMTAQREHEEEKDVKEGRDGRDGSGDNQRERAQSDPRDLSGRADDDGTHYSQHQGSNPGSSRPRNLSGGDEPGFNEDKRHYQRADAPRPSTSAGERHRRQGREGTVKVPEPQVRTARTVGRGAKDEGMSEYEYCVAYTVLTS